MSAVKWAFIVGALLIGAVLVGIFAQMASQGIDFALPEQMTEPKAETTPAEPATPVETIPEPVEPAKSVETVPEPVELQPVETVQEPAAIEPVEPRETVDYDLVSHWKLDGTLDDSGTAGIRGIMTGNELYTQGKTGQAFDFDGISYVLVPGLPQLNSPSFSVTFWMNPDQLRTQGIMDKVSLEGWTSGWRIFMNGNNGNIEFDASGEAANITTPPLAVEKWSFVAVSYDSGTQTAKIYLDGTLSSEISGVDMQNNLPNNLIMASVEEQRLDGLLDDVRFYNVALHEIQIREIYEGVV